MKHIFKIIHVWETKHITRKMRKTVWYFFAKVTLLLPLIILGLIEQGAVGLYNSNSTNCASSEKQCILAQTYGWPMNSWCVGNVTDMSELFRDMDTFNEDISGWDTSSVMSMWSMFNGATSFNGNLSAWDTSSVTDIWGMFGRATSFKCRICSVVLHHSTKIFAHGEISFHMTKLVVSFQTLAVPIQAHPKLIRKDHSVLLIVQ